MAKVKEREQGVVKVWIKQKGFGFIQRAGARDIFVHHTGILKEGYRFLEEGQPVSFFIGRNDRGPIAVDVEILEE